MASDNRSRILGDQGPSAPEHWTWGGPGKEVDVIILLFGADEATRNEALAAELSGLKGLSSLVAPVLTHLPDDEKEHFGFHDGISQPADREQSSSRALKYVQGVRGRLWAVERHQGR